jgi:hypothetical protein
MKIFKYKDFVLEKSIGSENIRSKWYSDMDKKTFYALVNLDPTRVRKKDFSKPGKYFKWLAREYKAARIDNNFLFKPQFSYLRNELNYYLFITTTGWFKKQIKIQNKLNPGYSANFDILKYKYNDFRNYIYKLKFLYERETEKAKFDILYSDDNLDVIIPLNFAASYQIAKNTNWCTQSKIGWDSWSRRAILYRVIFKDGEKLKITWGKENYFCMLASDKYPEINTGGNPFEIIDGKEKWVENLNRQIEYYGDTRGGVVILKKLQELLLRLSKESKNAIESHYFKHHDPDALIK